MTEQYNYGAQRPNPTRARLPNASLVPGTGLSAMMPAGHRLPPLFSAAYLRFRITNHTSKGALKNFVILNPIRSLPFHA
jgi:hypothetical protein